MLYILYMREFQREKVYTKLLSESFFFLLKSMFRKPANEGLYNPFFWDELQEHV